MYVLPGISVRFETVQNIPSVDDRSDLKNREMAHISGVDTPLRGLSRQSVLICPGGA